MKFNNTKRYGRFTTKGARFAERFTLAIRNLLQKLVFAKRNADQIDETNSAQ